MDADFRFYGYFATAPQKFCQPKGCIFNYPYPTRNFAFSFSSPFGIRVYPRFLRTCISLSGYNLTKIDILSTSDRTKKFSFYLHWSWPRFSLRLSTLCLPLKGLHHYHISRSVILCSGLIYTSLECQQAISIIQSIAQLNIEGERTQPSRIPVLISEGSVSSSCIQACPNEWWWNAFMSWMVFSGTLLHSVILQSAALSIEDNGVFVPALLKVSNYLKFSRESIFEPSWLYSGNHRRKGTR